MKKFSLIFVAGAILILGLHTAAFGTDQSQDSRQNIVQKANDEMFGIDLMTEQEIVEHKANLASFTSDQERKNYLRQHHDKMMKRADQAKENLSAVPAAGSPKPAQ